MSATAGKKRGRSALGKGGGPGEAVAALRQPPTGEEMPASQAHSTEYAILFNSVRGAGCTQALEIYAPTLLLCDYDSTSDLRTTVVVLFFYE